MPFARRETAVLLVGDAALLVVSLWVALTIRTLTPPDTAFFWEHLRVFIPIYGASLLIFFIAGLYEKQARLVKRILGVRIAGAQAANTLLAAVLFFVLPLAIAPKTVLIINLLVSVVLISIWRFFIVPRFSLSQRVPGVMVGEGAAVDEVLQAVRGNPKYFLDFPHHLAPSSLQTGSLGDAVSAALASGAQLVVLDSRDPRVRAALPTLYGEMLRGVGFMEFSTLYESIFDRIPLGAIDHAWLLEQLPGRSVPYAVAKRLIDTSAALIGIVLASPLLAAGMLAVRLSSSGPVLIKHERVGRRGKLFRILKLRTMLLDDHGDPVLRARNRVTRVGRILRRTRIDELPQLWNVLVGDLSFIGPRPELPALAAVYEREIPYYGVRHLITPGLSGWAQIYHLDPPRGAADVDRTCLKLAYDIYYLKHRSLGIDLAIALKTIRALASFSGS
jgi:lipopolysaccharide/colanic/teichoic acid biosynthesis glycosyltransferase